MRGMRFLCALLAALFAVCLLVSCTDEPEPASSSVSSGESVPAAQPSASGETDETNALPGDEASLPPPEAIVLLYTDYLTVRTEQDGLAYEYTYCFDTEQCVFNAVAVIRFPTEEEARREYQWLRKRSYPNLELEGATLSFCFPRRECPFYGIPYRSLEVLLEETVYEIIDRHPPEVSAESGET